MPGSSVSARPPKARKHFPATPYRQTASASEQSESQQRSCQSPTVYDRHRANSASLSGVGGNRTTCRQRSSNPFLQGADPSPMLAGGSSSLRYSSKPSAGTLKRTLLNRLSQLNSLGLRIHVRIHVAEKCIDPQQIQCVITFIRVLSWHQQLLRRKPI
jgi:hypothetical protein